MEKERNRREKERFKEKSNKIKTASSPEQDLHPDWDRFRGTMLYPLSCGELAINGEKILRLYVTSSVHTARNKGTKILKQTKTLLFDLKMFKFSSVPLRILNLRV